MFPKDVAVFCYKTIINISADPGRRKGERVREKDVLHYYDSYYYYYYYYY